MPNKLIILTAIGSQDRPGIIAALTKAVLDTGGNLDDATMTRLHGAFATMIAARVAEKDLATLKHGLDALGTKHGLHISIDAISDDGSQAESFRSGPDHVVRVYGADHPGIVHHAASVLASHGANITHLETRLMGEGGKAIYLMVIETAGGDWESLPRALVEMGKDQAVDVSVSPIDEETL